MYVKITRLTGELEALKKSVSHLQRLPIQQSGGEQGLDDTISAIGDQVISLESRIIIATRGVSKHNTLLARARPAFDNVRDLSKFLVATDCQLPWVEWRREILETVDLRNGHARSLGMRACDVDGVDA